MAGARARGLCRPYPTTTSPLCHHTHTHYTCSMQNSIILSRPWKQAFQNDSVEHTTTRWAEEWQH